MDYLRGYIERFNFADRIHLNSKVINIRRSPDGGHLVSYVKRATDESGEWETSTFSFEKFVNHDVYFSFQHLQSFMLPISQSARVYM